MPPPAPVHDIPHPHGDPGFYNVRGTRPTAQQEMLLCIRSSTAAQFRESTSDSDTPEEQISPRRRGDSDAGAGAPSGVSTVESGGAGGGYP